MVYVKTRLEPVVASTVWSTRRLTREATSRYASGPLAIRATRHRKAGCDPGDVHYSPVNIVSTLLAKAPAQVSYPESQAVIHLRWLRTPMGPPHRRGSFSAKAESQMEMLWRYRSVGIVLAVPVRTQRIAFTGNFA
jgi:hypothetical protein